MCAVPPLPAMVVVSLAAAKIALTAAQPPDRELVTLNEIVVALALMTELVAGATLVFTPLSVYADSQTFELLSVPVILAVPVRALKR